jgi:hypothetical protein
MGENPLLRTSRRTKGVNFVKIPAYPGLNAADIAHRVADRA